MVDHLLSPEGVLLIVHSSSFNASSLLFFPFFSSSSPMLFHLLNLNITLLPCTLDAPSSSTQSPSNAIHCFMLMTKIHPLHHLRQKLDPSFTMAKIIRLEQLKQQQQQQLLLLLHNVTSTTLTTIDSEILKACLSSSWHAKEALER